MEDRSLIKTKNLLLAGIIIIISGGAILMLLASSSVPVFSVKEAMDYSQPESLIERKIQIVGVVKDFNSTHFSMNDPIDVNNISLIIYVNATEVEKPIGFEVGRTVLVEGKLLNINENWLFRASMISTKCPSKYEG